MQPPVAVESCIEQYRTEITPDVLDIVAADPPVLELMVIIFPVLPVAKSVPVSVVVVADGKVTVFGAPIVMLLNVFAPEKITAPVPDPVI